MKKAALVTGGGGYIGGKLCLALLEKGYEVTALDVQFVGEEETRGIKRVQVKCSQFDIVKTVCHNFDMYTRGT